MEYDQTELEQYANFIVQNFSGLPDEQLDSFSEISELELDLTLLNAGVPISGEDFLTMIDAWQAGEEECGAFIGIGEYTAETTNDGVTLSAEAEYEDRNATIEFAFDDEMNIKFGYLLKINNNKLFKDLKNTFNKQYFDKNYFLYNSYSTIFDKNERF